MPSVPKARPARQARSRASLQRLVSAAQEILNTQGLEAATIPRMAAKAGLSPANVYRRFADKDTLLQEVFLRFVEGIDDDMQRLADPARWKGKGLAAIVRSMVADQIKGLRKYAGLARALVQYARRNSDAPFLRRLQALQLQTYDRMVNLYLSRREEIGHPDPAYAVRFGSTLVSFGLRDFVIALGAKPEVAASLGYSDQRLEQEMTRVFLSYLKVEE
jgi:AcrR family transcriptional regulator